MGAVFTEDTKIQACEINYYYDKNVRRCSPCEDICNNAALQRTELMCSLECPDFTQGSPKQELANSLSPAVIIPTGSPKQELANALSPAVIGLIIISALLVVAVAAAAAAIVICKKRQAVKAAFHRLASCCMRNAFRQEADLNSRDEEETELKETNVFINKRSREAQAAPYDDAVAAGAKEVRNMIPATDNSSPNYSRIDRHEIVCS